MLVVVVLASTDAVLGPDANLSATFAIAPFLAATGAKVRQTAAVACLASAMSVALSIHANLQVGVAAARASVVVLASLLAIFAAGQRVARERRLLAMTRVADIAQQAILLPISARIGDFRFASAYVSATEEAQLGGDFYEAVETADGIRLILGDVRGKGVEAVRLASLVLRYFRDAALTKSSLEEVAADLNRALTRHMDLEEFVTAVIIELRGAAMDVVNCGHHPPVQVAPRFRWIDAGQVTTPLGLDPEPRSVTIPLVEGDRMLLYTDGLAEARRPSGEFLSVEEVVTVLSHGDLTEAIGQLMATVRASVGGQIADDLAALVLEYRPGQAADPGDQAGSNR